MNNHVQLQISLRSRRETGTKFDSKPGPRTHLDKSIALFERPDVGCHEQSLASEFKLKRVGRLWSPNFVLMNE